MTTRSVQRVFTPPPYHFVGNGFRVHNFIPAYEELSMERMSPFILLDYNSKFYFPPSNEPRGVGAHPHRGFETVTIAYKGKVAHHDNAGNGGVIGEGDVQWMTAAKGILHKEYHEEEWNKKGGDFHMVQLWVNLPAKDKISEPKYQEISKDRIGRYELENGGEVEVIAGNYKGIVGAASTFTPMNVFNVKLNARSECELSFPENYNTALLVIEGDITVNSMHVPQDNFVLLANDGEAFSITANEDAVVLVLSGEPINEPIAARGPFVMNTTDEIIKAYYDYNQGKFGYLD